MLYKSNNIIGCLYLINKSVHFCRVFARNNMIICLHKTIIYVFAKNTVSRSRSTYPRPTTTTYNSTCEDNRFVQHRTHKTDIYLVVVVFFVVELFECNCPSFVHSERSFVQFWLGLAYPSQCREQAEGAHALGDETDR